MGEKSPEYGHSPMSALNRYEADCYWKSDSYSNILMFTSKYVEDELGVEDASGFVEECVRRGSLPTEMLFEVSPRETEERLKLFPVMELNDYQMSLLTPSDYRGWFAEAVVVALKCDKHLHASPDSCMSYVYNEKMGCNASTYCPFRSVRNKVMNGVYAGIGASAGKIWNPALTEEIVNIQLNVISNHNLIPPRALPSMMNAYRQSRLRAR